MQKPKKALSLLLAVLMLMSLSIGTIAWAEGADDESVPVEGSAVEQPVEEQAGCSEYTKIYNQIGYHPDHPSTYIFINGSTATAKFSTVQDCVEVSFSVYTYENDPKPYEDQTHYDSSSMKFDAAGSYELTIDMPPCGKTQLDLYAGPVQETLNPEYGHDHLTLRNFVLYAVGDCTTPTPTPTETTPPTETVPPTSTATTPPTETVPPTSTATTPPTETVPPTSTATTPPTETVPPTSTATTPPTETVPPTSTATTPPTETVPPTSTATTPPTETVPPTSTATTPPTETVPPTSTATTPPTETVPPTPTIPIPEYPTPTPTPTPSPTPSESPAPTPSEPPSPSPSESPSAPPSESPPPTPSETPPPSPTPEVVIIDDEEVPADGGPDDDDPTEVVEEETVPLDNLPKTGESSPIPFYLLGTFFTVSGLMALKRRNRSTP